MTSQIDSVSATHLFNCYQSTSKPDVNCCYQTITLFDPVMGQPRSRFLGPTSASSAGTSWHQGQRGLLVAPFGVEFDVAREGKTAPQTSDGGVSRGVPELRAPYP
jgi:hypothetical protein